MSLEVLALSFCFLHGWLDVCVVSEDAVNDNDTVDSPLNLSKADTSLMSLDEAMKEMNGKRECHHLKLVFFSFKIQSVTFAAWR